MRRLWPLLALPLAGCVYDVGRFPLREEAEVSGVPAGIAVGHARATSLLGLRALGDDSPELAARRARGTALETTLTQATVERRTSCLLSCRAPLVRHTHTTVTGTLVRPFGYSEPEPEPRARELSQRHREPDTEALYQRLLHLHGSGPDAARRFYGFLKSEERGALRDYVLSMKGEKSPREDGYRPSATLPEAEARFVAWFVEEMTALRLEPAAP